jgi:molecular chaperone HtpG
MSDLTTNAEAKALEARKYTAFAGIDLGFIKSKVDEITRHIGKDGIFTEYTRHDITHINQVLTSLNWIIPHNTVIIMKAGDWLMLVLGIYFHDLGMVVTQEEYDRRSESGFEAYKQRILLQAKSEFIDKLDRIPDREKFLYQEFVRSKHAERVKNWVEGKPAPQLGVASVVADEIDKMLSNLGAEFRTDLGMICESHHLYDLEDFSKYEVRRYYGSDENEHVNLHYCAILLRTADLLHITSDRTPSTEYRLINPSDPISQDEWAKQAAVKNVGAQPMRNEEGNVDGTKQSNTIEITALFKGSNGANGFFGLSSYISYARLELKKNHDWNQQAIKKEGSKYEFPWIKIDDSKVRTEGFEPKLFEFNLDQNKILQLLVGHTLYNDSTVVVRELIQNAIDAIKLQNHLALSGAIANFEPSIIVEWDTKTRVLSFIDNGTGMTQEIIEEHLLKVGSSRYQSDNFQKEYPDFTAISRFGIGILTCFLVADNVEIITNHVLEVDAKVLTIRNVNGKYLLQHIGKQDIDKRIAAHGTIIHLEIRADIELNNILEQLNKWVVFPPCPISLIVDHNKPTEIGFKSPKDAIINYLRIHDLYADNVNIKVVEQSINGITLAYAMKFNGLYKEWNIIKARQNQYEETEEIVENLGLCIEGIRVEFESPGFKNGGVIAIANASGQHAPKTNVARSDIEYGSTSSAYLSDIYSLYINYIEKELIELQKAHFSITWAANEVRFLLHPLIGETIELNEHSLSNSSLFLRELSKAKLLLIESDNKRFLVSLDDAKNIERIWMIDSLLFRSVESLVKEVKDSPSLLELVSRIHGSNGPNIAHIESLLCGFDQFGLVQKNAIASRSISDIKIFPAERRVDICWSTISNNDWIVIRDVKDIETGYRGRNTGSIKTFFIQSNDIDIENIGDRNVVQCFDFIFIIKGTPICNFILALIKDLGNIDGEDEHDIISIVLSFIQSQYEMKQEGSTTSIKGTSDDLEMFQHRIREYSLVELWDKIDERELIKSIVNTDWRVFTPSAWDRNGIQSILSLE